MWLQLDRYILLAQIYLLCRLDNIRQSVSTLWNFQVLPEAEWIISVFSEAKEKNLFVQRSITAVLRATVKNQRESA